MPEREYRKTVEEAECEMGRTRLTPAEDVLVHQELTQDHIDVAITQMARSAALLDATRRRLGLTEPRETGLSAR